MLPDRFLSLSTDLLQGGQRGTMDERQCARRDIRILPAAAPGAAEAHRRAGAAATGPHGLALHPRGRCMQFFLSFLHAAVCSSA